MGRIDITFEALKLQKKKAFISYMMDCYTNYEILFEIVKGLPEAGVDIIEL